MSIIGTFAMALVIGALPTLFIIRRRLATLKYRPKHAPARPLDSASAGKACVLSGATGETQLTTKQRASIQQSDTILHCAACGACSRPQQVAALARTASTLTGNMANCATAYTLAQLPIQNSHADASLRRCMGTALYGASNSGDRCMDCWGENIACTIRECTGECIKATIGGDKYKCLQCDEERCGSAFKRCAGANRRRAAVTTDIIRIPESMCSIAASLSQIEDRAAPSMSYR